MMKSIALLFIVLAAANAQNWVLSWNDEFDGSTIDRTKWTFDIGNNGWGNNELEYYTSDSENAYINNGYLVIQALQENYNGAQYTSARMKTEGLFSTVYGKFEISAQLPYGQGIWPGFWLLGENINQVGWPACGEIDIMENVGLDPNDVHGSTHGPGFDTTSSYNNAAGFSSGFHTYGVNWQPDNIQFYVDGNVYATVTPDNTNGAPFVFDGNPMFIILNLAIGGNWPGSPDSTTVFPQQFIIDYVRVWEIDWSS